jgi:hypothetical protein
MRQKDQPSEAPDEDIVVSGSTWEDELIERSGNLVRRNRLWLELELGRERRHWCPWRSTEEAAEDPDRSVSYEDVAPFLFQFTQARQTLSLLVGFARFLGVSFRDEPHLPTSLCSATVSGRMGFNSSEGLHDGIDWTADVGIRVLRDIRPDLEDDDFLTFCRNIFSQSVRALKEPFRTQMVSLWLRFEVDLFDLAEIEDVKEKKAKKKELKNLVKGLLVEDRDNVNVYVEYAQLEHRIEGAKAAWKILEATMGQHSAVDQPRLYVSAITTCLTEIEVNGDNVAEWIDRAIWLLCVAAGSDASYSAAKIPENKVELLAIAEKTKTNLLGELHGRLVAGKFITKQEDDDFWESPIFFKSGYLTKVRTEI